MALYDNILDTIGRTPVVKLNRLAPDHVSLYVKVESFNPGGSVKDRLALAIILDAEQRGLLKPATPSWKPPPATPAWRWPWSLPRVATSSSPPWWKPSRSSAAS